MNVSFYVRRTVVCNTIFIKCLLHFEKSMVFERIFNKVLYKREFCKVLNFKELCHEWYMLGDHNYENDKFDYNIIGVTQS